MYKARLLTLARVLEKFQLLTLRQMDFFTFVVPATGFVSTHI
jgi:hypothetical protein